MNATTIEVLIRKARPQDGKFMWKLVVDSGKLDVNSAYCYIMLCEYFGNTCFVAEVDGEMVGFVSAFLRPNNPEVLFVWQIAVSTAHRGKGIADSLLRKLLTSHFCSDVWYIETTITSDNQPSQRLFAKLAKRLQAEKAVLEGFAPHLFPDKGHAPEALIRIGPLPIR